jgi:hypothetical protein
MVYTNFQLSIVNYQLDKGSCVWVHVRVARMRLEIVYVSMSKSTCKSCVVAGLQVQN